MFMDRLHQYGTVTAAKAPPEQESVTILALLHGETVAEQMADYVNAAVGQPCVTGISYGVNASLASLRTTILDALQQRDCSAGVLILADMEPLTGLNELLFRNTGIHSATVANVSLPVLLAVAEASRQPEIMPGRDRGKVTVQKVRQRLAPILQAASSTEASMEERMPERVI